MKRITDLLRLYPIEKNSLCFRFRKQKGIVFYKYNGNRYNKKFHVENNEETLLERARRIEKILQGQSNRLSEHKNTIGLMHSSDGGRIGNNYETRGGIAKK